MMAMSAQLVELGAELRNDFEKSAHVVRRGRGGTVSSRLVHDADSALGHFAELCAPRRDRYMRVCAARAQLRFAFMAFVEHDGTVLKTPIMAMSAEGWIADMRTAVEALRDDEGSDSAPPAPTSPALWGKQSIVEAGETWPYSLAYQEGVAGSFPTYRACKLTISFRVANSKYHGDVISNEKQFAHVLRSFNRQYALFTEAPAGRNCGGNMPQE